MSTPVSGSLKNVSTSAVTSGSVVLRFILRGFTTRGPNAQQPLVPGVGVLISNDNNGTYSVDFTPDGSGNVSGTLYSTRDASGTGDGEIEIGTSKQACWYDMVTLVSGQEIATISVHAKNGVTLDPSSVVPITTPTVVAAPTGDTTYARLDGANQPFTSGVDIPSGAVYKISTDTGISRDSAGVIDFGNGTQGDKSGSIQAANINSVSGGTVTGTLGGDANGCIELGPSTVAVSNPKTPHIDFHFHDSTTNQNGQDYNLRLINDGNNQLSVYSSGSGGPTGPIINLTGTTGSLQFNGDTGLSRAASSTVAVGNGTANDASGSLQATSYRTATANPAASGIVRLAAGDTIAFRNTGNSADIALSKNGYDQITATGLSNRILQNFTSTALTGAGGLSFQAAASKTIKANSLGAHGALLIRLAGAGVTAAGGTANITVQFGGTNKTVLSVPQSTTYIFRLEALLCNQNQTGQQLITWTSQYNSTLSTQSNNTYTIDTTADQTLSLGVVFNNASDNCTFQNMLVEIMPASAAI